MSENVYVVSAAMIPFGKHRNSSYVGLAVSPLIDALHGAGIDKSDVDAVYVGHSYGGMMTGQRITKEIGLGTVPTVNVDNACSSGASALHEAWTAISQGLADVAVVIGVEKLTQFGGGTLPLSPEDREVGQGLVMPAVYAMRATRYLYENDAGVEDLARVSVKARRHGALNPFAQFRQEVTVEEVLAARPVADPLTLLMCCPTGDGAAVVVLASQRARDRLGAGRGPGRAIRVAASVLHSGQVEEGFRDMTKPEISYASARDAYAQAGVGRLHRHLPIIHLRRRPRPGGHGEHPAHVGGSVPRARRRRADRRRALRRRRRPAAEQAGAVGDPGVAVRPAAGGGMGRAPRRGVRSRRLGEKRP